MNTRYQLIALDWFIRQTDAREIYVTAFACACLIFSLWLFSSLLCKGA